MSSPAKDYVSITVSDRDGRVTLKTACSDAIADAANDSMLTKVGAMLLAEVQTGVISADLDADPDRHGEAMLVLEDDEDGSIDLNIIFDPVITPGDGQLSGAQALALSALQRVQHKLGVSSVTLDSVICD